jgi:uncharacterized protein (DUF433 family)
MFDAGASAEQIADEYESLTLDQVYGVIFYSTVFAEDPRPRAG